MKSNETPATPTAAETSQRKKLIILVVIVVLIVASVAYQWTARPAGIPSAVPAKPVQRASTLARPQPGKIMDPLLTEDPYVSMPDLKREKAERQNGNNDRNPFDFGKPPMPPTPPPSVCGNKICESDESSENCVADCGPPPPPPDSVCGNKVCQPGESTENCPTDCGPPPPPQAPQINLKYIGYVKEGEDAVAFLTDGKEVYMGRLNDIIANRYKVLKITEEGVELGYVNLNQSKTIPFEGNNRS